MIEDTTTSLVAPEAPLAPETSPQYSGVETTEDAAPAELAAVKQLIATVKKRREECQADFKRIRENMNFAAGFQWDGQEALQSKRYVANLTLRNVNQKVATLYAKNPEAEFVPRKRMDFQVYDGHMESIIPMVQQAQQAPAGILSLRPEQQATIADYSTGMQERALIARVGETLQKLYQWNFDEHDPNMKLQMKALVRRVVTCGVGYVRVGFEREEDQSLTNDEGISNSFVDTAKRIQYAMKALEAGDFDKDSAKMEELKTLMLSIQATLSNPVDQLEVQERLVFDFIRPTAVIVDKRCSSLKGFVGAEWVAVEYLLPVCEVNAHFGCDIKDSDAKVLYKEDGTECDKQSYTSYPTTQEAKEDPLCCLFEVINKKTKTVCFVVDGYKRYVKRPEPLPQTIYGFWPIQAITFNDAETEPGQKAPLYPPSDVELMRHAQKEYNRTREDLRSHRAANIPAYITMKNYLTQGDKDKITNAVSNQVIELEAALPEGMTPDQLLMPKTKVPIDEKVYDTSPLLQDVMYAVGTQSADLGQPDPQGTATGQTIAEQSRTISGNSNVDDFDDLLSWMARIGGEILLLESTEETVKRIVGPGAIFPTTPEQRKDFLNSVFLSSKAGSSGRPNKVTETNNWRLVAPILQAAGANPAAMVRETLRRADDQMDAEDFFPLLSPKPLNSMSPQQGEGIPEQSRPGPGMINSQENVQEPNPNAING